MIKKSYHECNEYQQAIGCGCGVDLDQSDPDNVERVNCDCYKREIEVLDVFDRELLESRQGVFEEYD
jgi:hypothetical protein